MPKAEKVWWRVKKGGTATPEPIMTIGEGVGFITLVNGTHQPIAAPNYLASNFFRTHAEARTFVIRRAERKVKQASGALAEAMMQLDMARDIPEREE